MKELDFDELDRAVATLMDKQHPDGTVAPTATPEQTTSVDAPETQTPVKVFDPERRDATPNDDTPTDTSADSNSDAAESSDVVAAPERSAPNSAFSMHQTPHVSTVDRQTDNANDESAGDDAPTENDASADASTDEQTPSKRIVPHRAGRFMDMKSDAKSADASAFHSRQGVTIQPQTLTQMPEPEPVATPAEAPAPAAPVEEPASTDLPDPLDMAMPLDTESDTTATTEEATSDEPTTLGQSDFSPFLTDAKPEKRPLGAPQTPAGDVEEPTAPPAVDQPIVGEEFDQKLMAIESGDIEKQLPSGAAETSNSEQPTAPSVDKKPEVVPTPMPKPAESTPVKPSGPISIPQQYDEQPSSGPEKSGAIFDTDTYHQPLKHPAKKSHGLLWVILIILIIVLGGAAGAAFYYGYI